MASARSAPPSTWATPATSPASPTSGHYARYTGTAPIAASSGSKQRHRLNPRGNRQLNRALHVAALTQVRNDTPGRAYDRRKLDEAKSTKEALRALKRQIAKTVYRHLVTDAHRRNNSGPGRAGTVGNLVEVDEP
jgi:transposase